MIEVDEIMRLHKECMSKHATPANEYIFRAAVERLVRRYQWCANELLVCDYGDNESGTIGWKVCGWRKPRRTIFGPSINAAVDAELP